METVEAIPPVTVVLRRESITDSGPQGFTIIEIEEVGVVAGKGGDNTTAGVPDREFDERTESTGVALGNNVTDLDIGMPEDVAAELDDETPKPLVPRPVLREPPEEGAHVV
jgi:hypothetical protein